MRFSGSDLPLVWNQTYFVITQSFTVSVISSFCIRCFQTNWPERVQNSKNAIFFPTPPLKYHKFNEYPNNSIGDFRYKYFYKKLSQSLDTKSFLDFLLFSFIGATFLKHGYFDSSKNDIKNWG